MEKIAKYRQVKMIDLNNFGITSKLDDLLDVLNECKSAHPNVELKFDYGGSDCYELSSELEIYYIEDESDEEYATRMEYLRKQVEEKERAELKRLISYNTLNEKNEKRLAELLDKFHNT